MKKYYVKDNGVEWEFGDKENARKKADEIDGEVEERIFWQYFAPYYTTRTSGNRKISGKDLVSAIEGNFDQIIKDYDMSGGSGYKLNAVVLKRSGQTAELIIDLNRLGKDWKPYEKVSKTITIEGVEENDIEGSEYVFRINK